MAAKQKDVWRSLDEAKELHEAGMRFTRCRFCRTSSHKSKLMSRPPMGGLRLLSGAWLISGGIWLTLATQPSQAA